MDPEHAPVAKATFDGWARIQVRLALVAHIAGAGKRDCEALANLLVVVVCALIFKQRFGAIEDLRGDESEIEWPLARRHAERSKEWLVAT
jgi:hypothetical protein